MSRSERLRQQRSCTPLQWASKACITGTDYQGFSVRFINNYIGRGTFATRNFLKGEFLLEYRGELITHAEGELRQESYPDEKGSFLFFFKHGGISLCIDGTNSTGACRMVNDGRGREANTTMKVILEQGGPHLCLFALKDIQAGEELRYDYGDKDVPWRKKNQRWADQLLQLEEGTGTKQVGSIKFSKSTKIADGSNGAQVYVGKFLGKAVAVKRVNSDFVGREVEMFLCLQNKNFKHVLKPLVIEKDEDFTYFVTELCQANLQEIIEDKTSYLHQSLTDDMRKRFCLEFLRGLQELHNIGILHRDINPGNVLLGN